MVLFGGLGGAVLAVANRSLRRRVPLRPVHAGRRRARSRRRTVAAPRSRLLTAPRPAVRCVKHWPHAALAHGRGVPRPRRSPRSSKGLPAHVQVTSADIADALARRRLGYGRGARMKFEQDEVRITGGVRHGLTQGGPVVDRDRQHRVAQVGAGDVRRPGRPRRARRAGPQRRADPAPARAMPTSWACRSTASTRRARSWSAPRPARPPPGSLSDGVASAFLEQATGARLVSHVVRARWRPGPRRLGAVGR